MDTDVAPATLHASTELPPGAMVEGDAVNERIVGAATVTVTLAVELPDAFVAVSV